MTPSGKSVRVQKWSQATVSSQAPCDHVVPGSEPRTFPRYGDVVENGVRVGRDYVGDEAAPVRTHRVQVGYNGEPYFTVNSYSAAYKWSGESVYQTTPGWGH